jgi:hypothetical protein
MSDFDELSPPGMMTHKGHCVSIDTIGTLYLQRGAQVATAKLSPLNWQLLGTCITQNFRPTIFQALDPAEVKIKKGRGLDSRVVISVRRLLTGQIVALDLNRSEVSILSLSALKRAPIRKESN